MTVDQKRRILIYFFLCAFGIILIAAALPQMDFKPGIPLPSIEGGVGSVQSRENNPLPAFTISNFLSALGAIILLMIMLYSAYVFFKGLPWKDLIKASFSITLITGIVLVILFLLTGLHSSPGAVAIEPIIPSQKINGPPLGPIPAFLLWLVAIGLFIVIIILLVWLIKERRQVNASRDALTLEAERALQAIKSGSDLKNVILHCYHQMSQALKKENGLVLEETMTAREFERLVEAKGFPHEPVEQLTSLFETARYSLQETGPGDEQIAIQCLNAIVQHSRSGKMVK